MGSDGGSAWAAVQAQLGASRKGRLIVPLREEGSKSPLFFAPPLFGNPVCYHDVVEALGAGRPVYGLQPPPKGEIPESLPELAGLYLDAIRTRFGTEPKWLAGWCFGALTVFEMARQMDEPPGLILMEAEPPVMPRERPALGQRTLTEFFLQQVGVPAGKGWRALVRAAIEPGNMESGIQRLLQGRAMIFRTGNPRRQFARIALGLILRRAWKLEMDDLFEAFIEVSRSAGLFVDESSEQTLRARWRPFRAALIADYLYEPETVRADSFLVCAESMDAESVGRGWRKWLEGGMSLAAIPGDHYSFVRPPLAEGLAAMIDGRIASG